MTSRPIDERCAAVREALLTGVFAGITRREADEHLAAHAACANWAARTLLLSHALAVTRRAGPPEAVEDQVLAAYANGTLAEPERRRVEDACCRDLKLAGRLERFRRQRLENSLPELPPERVIRLLQATKSTEGATILASLEAFRNLYRDRPLALAAAQAQRSVFQTPDGRFVVSVVDRGARQPGDPHAIELGIRVHEATWVGGWAGYRITDARGQPAAAGVVKVESQGTSVRITVPPTEHGPYTVLVQMLDLESTDVGRLLDMMSDASRRAGAAPAEPPE